LAGVWEGGVTEPSYRLLTDVDRLTTVVTPRCDGANLTGSVGPNSDHCDAGDSSCSCWQEDEEETRSPPNWPVFLLFIIVIVAIGGNVLVCLAVAYKRKLQNMFNFFLVSLALSDMLSAILVMPLSIVKTALGTFALQSDSLQSSVSLGIVAQSTKGEEKSVEYSYVISRKTIVKIVNKRRDRAYIKDLAQ